MAARQSAINTGHYDGLPAPYLIAPLAALASRGSRLIAAYFVVARGRKACPLPPPHHGGARSVARSPVQAHRSLQLEDHRTLHNEVDRGSYTLGDHERDDLNGKLAQSPRGEHGEEHTKQPDLQCKGHGVQHHDCDKPAS